MGGPGPVLVPEADAGAVGARVVVPVAVERHVDGRLRGEGLAVDHQHRATVLAQAAGDVPGGGHVEVLLPRGPGGAGLQGHMTHLDDHVDLDVGVGLRVEERVLRTPSSGGCRTSRPAPGRRGRRRGAWSGSRRGAGCRAGGRWRRRHCPGPVRVGASPCLLRAWLRPSASRASRRGGPDRTIEADGRKEPSSKEACARPPGQMPGNTRRRSSRVRSPVRVTSAGVCSGAEAAVGEAEPGLGREAEGGVGVRRRASRGERHGVGDGQDVRPGRVGRLARRWWRVVPRSGRPCRGRRGSRPSGRS